MELRKRESSLQGLRAAGIDRNVSTFTHRERERERERELYFLLTPHADEKINEVKHIISNRVRLSVMICQPHFCGHFLIELLFVSVEWKKE